MSRRTLDRMVSSAMPQKVIKSQGKVSESLWLMIRVRASHNEEQEIILTITTMTLLVIIAHQYNGRKQRLPSK